MDIKELNWVGTSLDDLKSMPEQVRKLVGYQLHLVQSGLNPIDWKPMKSVGKGAREIRVQYRGQYRVIYVTIEEDAVTVLHAFIKKTQKTRKEDIDIAKNRYNAI